MEHERYNGDRYETPRTWLAELPVSGIWELNYVTPDTCGKKEPGMCKCNACVVGCCALPDLRKRLAVNMLGWEFGDDDNGTGCKWLPATHEGTSISNMEIKAVLIPD